ncbi:MAG: hypothetical protein U0798_07720 [Gemmataceae bacterium]
MFNGNDFMQIADFFGIDDLISAAGVKAIGDVNGDGMERPRRRGRLQWRASSGCV